MADGDFRDFDALLAGDGGQESVHLAVELQRLHDLRAKRLERAAVIMQADACRHGNDFVGDERRQAAREKWILALLAPAAHDVGSSFEPVDDRWNIARVVLEVAVGRHDNPGPSVIEPGGKRRRLAEIAAEANHAQTRVGGLQPRENLEAVIGAPIVDDDELVRAPGRDERLRQLAVELFQRGRFVSDWYDDAELRRHVVIIRDYRLFSPCALVQRM